MPVPPRFRKINEVPAAVWRLMMEFWEPGFVLPPYAMVSSRQIDNIKSQEECIGMAESLIAAARRQIWFQGSDVEYRCEVHPTIEWLLKPQLPRCDLDSSAQVCIPPQ